MSVNSLLNSVAGIPKNYAGYNEGLNQWLNELKEAGIITGFIAEFVSADRPNIITVGMSDDKKDLVLNGVGLYAKQKELAASNGLDISSDVLDVDEDETYFHILSSDYFRRKYLNA